MQRSLYMGVFILASLVLLVSGEWSWTRHLPVSPLEPRPVGQAFYVWQRQWSTDVSVALQRATPYASGFMVLVAEIDVNEGRLDIASVHPQWESFTRTDIPLTIVIRAGASLAPLLADPEQRTLLAAQLRGIMQRTLDEAHAADVEHAGVQIDYDCPTLKLSDYEMLLDALPLDRSQTPLSITVLPDWLTSPTFAKIVCRLDYYVLQAHSLERPTSPDDVTVLCRTDRIPGYLDRAAALEVPFYLALPTYGYELAFNAEGRFVGLVDDGPRPDFTQGVQSHVVMADPGPLSEVVRHVTTAPPKALRGIVWFRLPVASDRLNWSWSTLCAVMEGRTPKVRVTTEIRRPGNGLQEIWVVNKGENTGTEPAWVHVVCDRTDIEASDLMNEYNETSFDTSGFILAGPTPAPGTETLAGWYRCRNVGLVSCSIHNKEEDVS